ncbi:MAG: flagellar export protein FliJ [Chitinispirillaceae bacterium]|jgi:flagellar FliJ protein|nr:flagellar export protein FliJ [Chitinispirillaceae bacterium]
MKQFAFRLKTVLDMRQRREDEIKLLLGKKNQEITAVKNAVAEISGALHALQVSEKNKRLTVTNAEELRHAVAYRFRLKQDLLKKARVMDELGAQAGEITRRLVRAKQERRAIEIVKEHQYAEWHKQRLAQEQQFIDDISQQAYIRRGKSSATIATL